MLNRAIFLDRDGTLNIEKNYLYKIKDWEWIPGAIDAIKEINRLGYKAIIVTNQAGIARKYYSETELNKLHAYMIQDLEKQGAKIDAIYYCPHHPDFSGSCECRKPKGGMLETAAKDLRIDLLNSWLVGDKISDINAAKSVKATPILVKTGYGESEQHQLDANVHVAETVAQAVRHIKHELKK